MMENDEFKQQVFIRVVSYDEIYNDHIIDSTGVVPYQRKQWMRQLVSVYLNYSKNHPSARLGRFDVYSLKSQRRVDNALKLYQCENEVLPELEGLFDEARYLSDFGNYDAWSSRYAKYIHAAIQPNECDIFVIKELLIYSPFRHKGYMMDALAIYESAFVNHNSFIILPIPENMRDNDTVSKLANHFGKLGFNNATNHFLIKGCRNL